jgi:GT2 family glycosyltransferase
MNLPAYSVIIPTYGQVGLDLLKELLPVMSYSCRLSHEVTVVDDGSPEEICVELEHICKTNGAAMMHNTENCGFAAACNAGINHSNGHIVILCNNDVIPINNTFDQLAEYTFFHGLGTCGIKLVYPDNRVQHAGVYYVLPPEGQTYGWFDHYYRFSDRHFIGTERIRTTLCTGALLAINGGVINAIGGLDERFGMAVEDIDYQMRVIECGMTVAYNGYIEAYHLEGKTRGNTVEGKAAHPEWTKKEEEGFKTFYSKWYGIDFTQFAMKQE